MSLAGREPKVYRQTVGVHNGVDLTRQSASRAPHMLLCIARDAGPVLVHAYYGSINHLHGRIMACGQRIHQPVPNASLPPANEAVVAGGRRPVALRQIAPRSTRTQNPK